jgi:hypothetical protein
MSLSVVARGLDTGSGTDRYQRHQPEQTLLYQNIEQHYSTFAALELKPEVNLARFHSIFNPNSKYRALIATTKRGKGNKSHAADETQEQTSAERRTAMSWRSS